jgi:hypothetical protein
VVIHPKGAIAPPGCAIASVSLEATMLDPMSSPLDVFESLEGERLVAVFDEDATVEWSEEDIVLLHWRLLQEVADLRDPATPLEDKLDTLRWIFTDDEKESRPFSFVNCLRIVGCSPLSPAPYFGLVDPETIRESIGRKIRIWLNATLERYPPWVREAVLTNPEWIESRLERNPQWINEQVKKRTLQGDLFA